MAWPPSKKTKRRKPAPKRKAAKRKRPVRRPSSAKAPIVRVKRVGNKYAVTVGGQTIGRATNKAAATKRAAQLRTKAKTNPSITTLAKKAANPADAAQAYKIFHARGLAAAITFVDKSKQIPAARKAEIKRDLRDYNKPPTITRSNPSKLHVVAITPGNYGAFLGKYCLKSGFKTKTGAEAYITSIHRRKRNPAPPKVAARVGREFLKTFDVDSDGDLDKNDLKILEHFNDATVVIDDREKQTGNVIADLKDGSVVVEWADGSTSIESKKSLRRVNGFRSWRLRRAAARAYSKELKAEQRLATARKRSRKATRRARRVNPLNSNTKAGKAFAAAVKKLANKTATRKQLVAAMNAGKKAGLSQTEVWRIVRTHWNKAAKAHGKKRNPGVISTLAEIFMGTSAALDVHRQLAAKPKKKKRPAAKAKPAARKRNAAVPSRSRNGKTTHVRRQNPGNYEKFQGRMPDKYLDLDGPVNIPSRTWCLGRLEELKVRGKTPYTFPRKFWLLGDDSNKNLWIAGGPIAHPDPAIKEGEIRPLGTLDLVAYKTKKDHLFPADEVETTYEHKFGEEGGRKPVFGYDRNGYGHIVQGDFRITPEGIRN